jgi:NADH-quinone oxidoreductase subunit G/NADP-reducing hydrogenase subunit HndD
MPPKKQFKIKLNGRDIVCQPGQTIFEVATEAGVEIPTLCEHPDFPHKANCRVCVVEVKDRKGLSTACSTPVMEGMEIRTDTPRVKRSRNLNLEMIFADHIEKCATCVWRLNCKLLHYAEKYKIPLNRFKDRKGNRPTYKFENAVELDATQCIDCRNCIEACSKIAGINYLELRGKGANQEVVPVKKKGVECILCGQCAVHCPVSSAQEQYHYAEVEKLIKEGKKTIVAQFAPSIRVSIGEEFGLPYGRLVEGQLVEAMKLLGFSHVFDVNFAADITTIVEADELLERITSPHPSPYQGEGKRVRLPMFTSCCPAWIRYVEYYRPDLIPNITTARSPQIHSGGLIKTFWAQNAKINPKDIIVVSIMPCTSKKYEAARPELKVKGLLPVDFVLTTRELAFMIKKANIDFTKLKGAKADEPLGEYTGAAAIYGGSGGVMESALRTAQARICGEGSKLCKTRLEFLDTRGLDGIKEATVDFGKAKLRVAVVNGMKNAIEFLPKYKDYDYIEIMACPGGCIGGGGEPIPTTAAIRKARVGALYKLDKGKNVREAHKNKTVIKTLEWLSKQGKLEHQVLHTSYKKRK